MLCYLRKKDKRGNKKGEKREGWSGRAKEILPTYSRGRVGVSLLRLGKGSGDGGVFLLVFESQETGTLVLVERL